MIKVAEIIEQHRAGRIPGSTIIKMAAFKAELEKRAINQLSFMDQLVHNFANGLPVAAAVAAGSGMGALIYEGIKGIEKAWTGYHLDASKEPKFQEMLKLHPELGENEATKERAALYFDSLWHFSPSIAQDPLAAGAYVKQSMSMHNVAQGPIVDNVRMITEVQKNIRQGTPEQEYSTPLGAIFLSLKPQAGGVYGMFGKPDKNKEPHEYETKKPNIADKQAYP